MDSRGIPGILLPRDDVDYLPARGFNAANGSSCREGNFSVAPVKLSRRHFSNGLAKYAAALHNFECAHQQTRANIPCFLNRHVEL